MVPSLSLALLSIAPFMLFMPTVAQNPPFPSCMSNCISPDSPSHESDTCTTSWISTVSTCIDKTCSTAIPLSSSNASVPVNSDINMTIVPNTQSACVSLPEKIDQTASSAILAQNGTCAESSYPFLSFLPTYIDSSAIAACRLLLFDGAGCAGTMTNLSISQGEEGVQNATCNSAGGNSLKLVCPSGAGDATAGQTENAAAHVYLNWLCNIQATTSPSAITVSLFATATSSAVNAPGSSCPGSNSTCTVTASANSTMIGLVATPTVGIVVQSGLAVADRITPSYMSARWFMLVMLAVGDMLF